ncbi:MAG: hypothetical protein IKW79_00175, partial [Schwartzia sp.]|nr:hypothetical protein [Schwartzia sp. (in: firmicutes)]
HQSLALFVRGQRSIGGRPSNKTPQHSKPEPYSVETWLLGNPRLCNQSGRSMPVAALWEPRFPSPFFALSSKMFQSMEKFVENLWKIIFDQINFIVSQMESK